MAYTNIWCNWCPLSVDAEREKWVVSQESFWEICEKLTENN